MVIDAGAEPDAAVRQLRGAVELARTVAERVSVLLITNQDEQAEATSQAYRKWLRRRMVTDRKANFVYNGFRELGCSLLVFESDLEFIRFVQNEFRREPDKIYLVYEIGVAGFGAAHRALVPTFCARYGLLSMNSAAAARAISWHKAHATAVLAHHGIPTPRTWTYTAQAGWTGGRRPPSGRKVIAKSTYSAMAVGVDHRSVFHYDDTADERLAAIERDLGEPVTVQDFVPGEEVYLTVLEAGALLALPPVVLRFRDGTPTRDAALTFDRNLGDGAISFEPLRLEPKLEGCRTRMVEAAAATFRLLEFAIVGRFDFRLTETGDIYLFDIAETPSFSDYHATARAFAPLGFAHAEIPALVLALNLHRAGLLARSTHASSIR